jgi:hypothetical protein
VGSGVVGDRVGESVVGDIVGSAVVGDLVGSAVVGDMVGELDGESVPPTHPSLLRSLSPRLDLRTPPKSAVHSVLVRAVQIKSGELYFTNPASYSAILHCWCSAHDGLDALLKLNSQQAAVESSLVSATHFSEQSVAVETSCVS